MRLVCSNALGTPPNMLEFLGVFDKAPDPALRESFATLMDWGTRLRASLPTVGQVLTLRQARRLSKRAILPWYRARGYSLDRLVREAGDAFYDRACDHPLGELIFGAGSAGMPAVDYCRIDRGLQAQELRGFSVHHDVALRAADFPKEAAARKEVLLDRWLAAQARSIPGLRLTRRFMKIDPEQLVANHGAAMMLLAGIIDVALVEELFARGWTEHRERVREAFYGGALGNAAIKAQRLLELFGVGGDAPPDAIAVQETQRSLTEALTAAGYVSWEPPGVNSRVFLRGKRWELGSARYLRLQPGATLPAVRLRRETSLLVATMKDGVRWAIASLHASSSGQDAVAQVQAVVATLAAEGLEALPLVIAHDANTSHDPRDTTGDAATKVDVACYIADVAAMGFEPAWSRHHSTVHKCRSPFQSQPSKALRWFSGRSDLIIARGAAIAGEEMIPPGPRDPGNPSDHAILKVQCVG